MDLHRFAENLVDFRSDNTGVASPKLLAAMAEANSGTAASYGNDRWTGELQRCFADVFEAEVQVFPVATGTAANALSLAAVSPPWGAIYCSKNSHIETSEANATAFFGGGIKLSLLDGDHGKLSASELEKAIVGAGVGLTQRSQPAAISLTQATDLGAVYELYEIRSLAEIAQRYNLRVHMDGARLANALVRLGCTPAELTWKSGVDILSFGTTKNGGMLCDAIVVFRPEIADRLVFQIRRSGHMWSKMRFAAAQLLAYVENGYWLQNAERANAIAERIAAGLRKLPGLKPLAPIQANEVFLEIDGCVMDGLEADGIAFSRRGRCTARFVCRFDSTASDADALLLSLSRHIRLASSASV